MGYIDGIHVTIYSSTMDPMGMDMEGLKCPWLLEYVHRSQLRTYPRNMAQKNGFYMYLKVFFNYEYGLKYLFLFTEKAPAVPNVLDHEVVHRRHRSSLADCLRGLCRGLLFASAGATQVVFGEQKLMAIWLVAWNHGIWWLSIQLGIS